MRKKRKSLQLSWNSRFSIALGVILLAVNTSAAFKSQGRSGTLPEADSINLITVRKKLAMLEKAVSEARAEGMDTRYEDVTITTAGLFLNTYIPWDIEHPEELTSAYSRSRKQYLKGSPQEEALRTPEWELQQTSDIIEDALAKLAAVRQNPDSRRPVPIHNVSNLKVVAGFLNSNGSPAFSGGFIWAPFDISNAYFGLIGNDVGFPELIGFNSPQSNGTLSDSTIARMLRKLNYLQVNNQRGSIGFGHSIPGWAVDKWPDINDYKTHHYNYDIDHPQVKGLWENLLSQLIPGVRNHPAKFDYQLAIEPQWPSVGSWQVNNASPYTFQRYRAWLGELYGTVDALNNSWGTDYGNFSEIDSRPSDNLNPAIWYDWCRFNQWRVTDFFEFMEDEIHKYDSNALCHIRVSTGGINQGRTDNRLYSNLHNGIDREALVNMTQINGLDNFMEDTGSRRTHDLYNENDYSLNWIGHTIVLDYIRSLAPDNLIYDSEWHSVSSVYYLNPELPPGYMHTALWLSSLHGMGATKTWYWSRRANGSPGRFSEEFYGSVLVQPRLLNEYGVGLAELNAFGKEVVALERAPKQICLLYSESSAIQSVDYLNNQMITYEALQFTGLPVGFVTENDLITSGLPESCRWLVVADASHVSQHTLDWLRDYIKGGDKLLIIGDNALKYNEYGIPYSSDQLAFIFGTEELDVMSPQILLGKIEALMAKTDVKRSIRCIDNMNNQTAWGVMCRSVEFDGGYLVCLINLSSVQKEVSLELNGKTVSETLDLFENKLKQVPAIQIDPLTVQL
ncbi:beta-galactosidase, partial [Bacteroidota bacterium]